MSEQEFKDLAKRAANGDKDAEAQLEQHQQRQEQEAAKPTAPESREPQQVNENELAELKKRFGASEVDKWLKMGLVIPPGDKERAHVKAAANVMRGAVSAIGKLQGSALDWMQQGGEDWPVNAGRGIQPLAGMLSGMAPAEQRGQSGGVQARSVGDAPDAPAPPAPMEKLGMATAPSMGIAWSSNAMPKSMERPTGSNWGQKILGGALATAGEHAGSFRLPGIGISAGAAMRMAGMRGPGDIAKDLPKFMGLMGGESKGAGGLAGLLFGGKEGAGAGQGGAAAFAGAGESGGNDTDLLAAIRKLTESVDKLVAVMGGTPASAGARPGVPGTAQGATGDVLANAMKMALDGLRQQQGADNGVLSAIARNLPTVLATAAAAL